MTATKTAKPKIKKAALRDELQRIYDQAGQLTPALVLASARDDKSPLHWAFDWDDAAAAHAHRLDQAQRLIQRHKVRYIVGDQDLRIRRWISVPSQSGPGRTYEPAENVAADEFTRRLVLQEMERDWLSLKRRYEQFEEFTELVLRDLGAA